MDSFEWAQPLALFDKIRAPALTQVLEETYTMAGADRCGFEQSPKESVRRFNWCERRDSNPQYPFGYQILSLARLPVPPLSLAFQPNRGQGGLDR